MTASQRHCWSLCWSAARLPWSHDPWDISRRSKPPQAEALPESPCLAPPFTTTVHTASPPVPILRAHHPVSTLPECISNPHHPHRLCACPLTNPLGSAQAFDTTIDAACPQTGPFEVIRCTGHQHFGSQCLSLIDLDAIKRTAQLLTSTGRLGVVVLNAAPPTASTLLDDARALAEATGLRVARAVLRERSAYRAAWPYGLGVAEHEPKGKAAQEIAALQSCFLHSRQNNGSYVVFS